MINEKIMIKSSTFDYPVLIGENNLDNLGATVSQYCPAGKALLVTDDHIDQIYGNKVFSSLAEYFARPVKVSIRPGEESKTPAMVSLLYDRAIEEGLDRHSPVIALGGGIVGDLAGFVAATYLRGVPLVMVPTSLLAQVDSSVGGKVAVNHPHGKNLIGAIYPPRLVVIDPLVLKTLPAEQYLAGLAEVVKYGVIEDSAFFPWLENNMTKILNRQSDLLVEALAASVRSKARVVEKDEFENDYRRILNFGHTVGHALEAATSYRYFLHGEAVLIGMILAIDLALTLGLLERPTAERIRKLLDKLSVKKAPTDLTAEMVIGKLRQDKKRRDEEIVFVLPCGIGKAQMVAVRDINLVRDLIGTYLDSESRRQ